MGSDVKRQRGVTLRGRTEPVRGVISPEAYAYVRPIVDAAPPISDATRERLSLLLRPMALDLRARREARERAVRRRPRSAGDDVPAPTSVSRHG
jgi:hypothetical protein